MNLSDIENAHAQACLEGKSLFTHPETGLSVMTRVYHLNRGKCCGNKCLFCPYGHVNVPEHSCSDKECGFVILYKNADNTLQ